jgi:hypothetical protein
VMATDFEVDLERLVADCIMLADELIRRGLMDRR